MLSQDVQAYISAPVPGKGPYSRAARRAARARAGWSCRPVEASSRVGVIRSCRSLMNVLGHCKHRWIAVPEFVSRFWPRLFLLRIRPFRK